MLVFVVRIWFGLSRNRSLASLDVIVSGLELMIASTSHVKVCKDSSFNQFPCSQSKVSRILCEVLMCFSQTLPMRLAPGGLNFQSICCRQSFSLISSWSIFLIALRSSPFTPTKLVPLSHLNSRVGPLRMMKRRSAFRKLSVSSEWVISMRTAQLTRQVKSAPCPLFSLRPSFTKVKVKGGAGVSRSCGRLAIFCSSVENLLCRHVTHEEITCRTAKVMPTIQYLSHNLEKTCPHPTCPSCSCPWWMINVVRWPFQGRITGCLESSEMSALFNRPPTQRIPSAINGSRW